MHELRLFSWLDVLVAVLLTISVAAYTAIMLGAASTGSQHLTRHSADTIGMNIITVHSI